MLIDVRVGKGRLIMSGSFTAHAYGEIVYEGFEQFLWTLTSASGAMSRWWLTGDPDLTGVAVRTGLSGTKRLLFLLNAGSAKTVTVHPAEKGRGPVREWVTGKTLPRQPDGSVRIKLSAPCHRVLEWRVVR
jgi:hypothetical protein